jgi:hypothetical protein
MKKHLNFGVYEATDAFRAIKQHSCVCFDDMGLVAVTGPADDEESKQYAELFAAAPDILAALEGIMEYMKDNDLIDCVCDSGDDSVGLSPVVCEYHQAVVAVAKAKGESIPA